MPSYMGGYWDVIRGYIVVSFPPQSVVFTPHTHAYGVLHCHGAHGVCATCNNHAMLGYARVMPTGHTVVYVCKNRANLWKGGRGACP
jgi:hypothetical protein